MPALVLLGPQRLRPNLADAVTALGIEGSIAAVTAGWQEREDEDDELRDHLGGRTVNLHLHRRAEEAFADDPTLFAAHRERQNELRELQELYGRRLDHALAAARELAGLDGESELLAAERRAALEAVRDLDRHHLDGVRVIHRSFERRVRPRRRRSIQRHRAELATLLGGCDAVAIAGGHVAVLLNRLRLFDLLELAAERPLLAWSAGAMALADRVVVFHDSPPQGPGNAEVLERGLDRLAGLLPFPHARRRLRLGDPARISLLARRFAPAGCVALDGGDWLVLEDGWRAVAPARRLLPTGAVKPVEGKLE